ncbi:MAG: HEAT repeat domain-containing protein, partial [Anaeromyxobacteraceae bacterium]
MTADRGDGAPDERDADGGAAEERRYRAVLDLDPRAAPALPALLGWLEDPSWRVRRAAAEQLSRAEPALAVPVLVASLASEGGAGLRNAAAAALVQIGPPALPALVEALGAPGADVRVAVVEILGDVGDRRAASAVAALLGDLDSNARAGAAEALGKIGGPEALPALDAALASGDVALRRAALGALGRLRAPPSGARLTALAADRALRRTALRVAATSDDPAALELLAAALADPSRTAREAALAGLGQQRLRGADARRVAAAVARAVARAPAAVAAAAAALEDEDLATRAGAVVVLAGSGDARHARALACAAEDERLAALVAEALAALGAGLGDALAPELPSLPPAAHAAALAALARRGDARALRPLVVALASEDLAARVPAVLALAALGTPEAVDALVEALGHRDAEVSGAAAAALAEVVARGGASAARALGAARARVPAPAALRLLGRAGVEGDLELLRAGLRAPHRGARIAAAGALASLAERLPVARPPAPELLDALDDGDAAVRAAA